MEPPPDSQVHSFLSTEFFFYMLPCYVAICSFAYRYYTIIGQEPIRNVNELPGEVMVTCLEETYDFDSDDTVIPPASYTIKTKLSLMNCYVYVGMVLIGILGDPDIYYSAQHRAYSLLYLFGVVAWGMSALLLRREFQRSIGQSLWTHRFFWIFAGTFSITKMFEDYLLPLNLIINVVFIASNIPLYEDNGVLAMYAMYRPEDRDDNYFQMNDMPSFARIFFQKLELNEYVRKYLRIENQPLKINVDDLATNEQDIAKDLQAFKTSLNSKAKAVAEGIDLLNRLPRRNIIVNNRVRTKKINDTFKYYFVLITQIGVNRFEAERKFSEFVDLENSLSVHFSDKNFPKLRLPKLKKMEFNNIAEGESTRRAEILEEWLKELLNNPIYMIDPVLKFLNIDEENSAPFLTYYNVSYTSLCSEVFLFNAFREKKQIEFRQQRVSVWGAVLEEESNKEMETLAKLISIKMEFEVVPDEESLASGQYKFALACKTPKKQPIRWTISKSEDQFAALNERIEEQTDSMVPIYYQSVLKIPEFMRSKTKVTKEKLEAYGTFLQRLLDSSEYYTFALFEFVMFDPVKLELVHDRSNLAALHSREPQSSNSKLAESYPATDSQIEVLKIRISDSKDQLVFKFLLRKKGVGPFSKTASELVQLRTKIVRIYKGIASVPELQDFSHRPAQSELLKIKQNVDNFLMALEGLPQIQTNQAMVQFYTVDINPRFSESSTAQNAQSG